MKLLLVQVGILWLATTVHSQELASLEAAFNDKVKLNVEAPFLKAVSELNGKYALALERQKSAAQELGKLDEALALEAEIVSITSGKAVPLELTPSMPDGLAKLRKTYRDSYQQLQTAKDNSLKIHVRAYSEGLESLRLKLTKAGSLTEAAAIAARLEALRTDSGHTPTGTQPAGSVLIEVLAGTQPPIGAKVIVTEAHAEDEETIIIEGVTEAGKFTLKSKPEGQCNLYIILDGHNVTIKKGQSLTGTLTVSLKPLPVGTAVRIVPQGTGFALFPDDKTDFAPVRANQGSPPFQWIFKTSSADVTVDAGEKRSDGEFWVKHGEDFRGSRNGQTATCKLLGSIARKYVLLELKARKKQ